MSNLHPIFENILGAWQSAPRSSQLPPSAQGKVPETQAIRTGMPVAKRRGMNQRCKCAEYLGSNRGIFECPKGHRFRQQMMKRAPNGRPPSETAIKMMAHWWAGGVYMPCPRCEALSASEGSK